MNARAWTLLAGVLLTWLWAQPIAGAQASPGDAKRYFEAGAAAYSAGDYQAAAQAFEVAYRLQPLPAIAFSLAQAERRQYFVSHDVAHLTHAIELYRSYLAAVPKGGRRADATDALAQLEPLALARSAEPALSDTGSEGVEPAAPQTRLMVRCQAPNATVALDAAAPVPAPLISETSPGAHRVRVEAPGYFPAEQEVTAVAGELVPIEVALRQRPAVLRVEGDVDAEVYVDGSLARPAADGRLMLDAGSHVIAFAKKGRRLQRITVGFSAGETKVLTPQLKWTGQRITAVTLFAVAGGALVTGGVFTGLALGAEHSAHTIDAQRRVMAISPAQRVEYGEAVDARSRSRIVAVAGLGVGVATLLSGLLLFQLDDPTPGELAPRASADLTVTLQPGRRATAIGLRLGGRL